MKSQTPPIPDQDAIRVRHQARRGGQADALQGSNRGL